MRTLVPRPDTGPRRCRRPDRWRLGVAVDVRGRTASDEAVRASEQRYRELFEQSPVSLWEEDFSAVKTYIDDLCAAGVSDVSSYLAEHPEAVLRCAQLVK